MGRKIESTARLCGVAPAGVNVVCRAKGGDAKEARRCERTTRGRGGGVVFCSMNGTPHICTGLRPISVSARISAVYYHQAWARAWCGRGRNISKHQYGALQLAGGSINIRRNARHAANNAATQHGTDWEAENGTQGHQEEGQWQDRKRWQSGTADRRA